VLISQVKEKMLSSVRGLVKGCIAVKIKIGNEKNM